eukprot:COSAG05_NODE_2850_length_2573_cov_2.078011_1_plen_83_part_00
MKLSPPLARVYFPRQTLHEFQVVVLLCRAFGCVLIRRVLGVYRFVRARMPFGECLHSYEKAELLLENALGSVALIFIYPERP